MDCSTYPGPHRRPYRYHYHLRYQPLFPHSDIIYSRYFNSCYPLVVSGGVLLPRVEIRVQKTLQLMNQKQS